jgi:uncharacterized Zn finger protein
VLALNNSYGDLSMVRSVSTRGRAKRIYARCPVCRRTGTVKREVTIQGNAQTVRWQCFACNAVWLDEDHKKAS